MSRHQRDRSRDRHNHGYRGRSQSSDSYQKKKRSHHRSSHQTAAQAPSQKRVKFNDVPDIKVFKKEDEPNSKGLTDVEVQEYMKKLESERGFNSFNNMNWENMKHRDAQLQSNSIREQKEKEKILSEKLQSLKEEIPFYPPLILKSTSDFLPAAEGSIERVALATRLNDVLACFYVQQSQIPSEPSFQIQNKSTSLQPKLINFDKQRIDNKDLTNTTKKNDKKDQKPIKGILKMTNQEKAQMRAESEPRKIDPALITLLKEIQNNKGAYTKERTQMLLRPYKESGQLDYLKKNPTILNNLMRDSSVPSAASRFPSEPSGAVLPDPYRVRHSISPQPEKPPMAYQNPISMEASKLPSQYQDYGKSQYGHYDAYNPYGTYPGYQHTQMQQTQPTNPNINMMGNYNTGQQAYPPTGMQGMQGYAHYPGFPQQNPTYMPNRNYKTIPCKYFHSPQGCVKANNCTFIHEQQYAGKPTPYMLKSNRGMVTNYGPTPTDNSQMGGNFYQHYPNESYDYQN